MSLRNFDALFHPRAIAVIGASDKEGALGRVLARNLLEGGFAGPILPVNPHATAIHSTLAYRSASELPVVPDLAVIATPPGAVPGIVAQLGASGCRAAVVITAGLTADQRQEMLDAARPHLLRIVGPNCLGLMSPAAGINASFAHLAPRPGRLALVAQSGAVAAAAMDWAQAHGVGFSHVVTLGDAADVDFGDMLDYLALDPGTDAILLYVESVRDARKFMSAGRIAARSKPVVVLKSGRSAAGARAAFSHTGALAGADAVYDAAFRRAGMLRVDDLRELFDAAATLQANLTVRGDRLAILTNGGGAGVMAADALDAGGGHLSALSPATLAALDKAAPANWSRANPADIIGDATPKRYSDALVALLGDDEADAILVINCPTAIADSTAAADAVIGVAKERDQRIPILTCWMGDIAVAEGRRHLAAAGLPSHDTPEEAVRAFLQLVDHQRNQTLLLRTPAAPPIPDAPDAARRMIDQALADGRDRLGDRESRDLLRAYGIPTVESCDVSTPGEAAQAAARLGGSVALKIRSPDITHKSDAGGVMLNLSADAVAQAAEAMSAKVSRAAPAARIDGFTLQPMIVRTKARELLAGIVCDPTFGPVVLFGHGGVAAEVIADRALALAPLDDVLARDMIARTRVAGLLNAYRDWPAADIGAIADVLIRLARMATDLPEIAELDINPLLADSDGVLALDARIRLQRKAVRAAILPYPQGLRRAFSWDGRALVVRPVRPDDAPRLMALVAASTPEDVRFRFGGAALALPPAWAARLSQIDYDREMAFVAEDADGALLGVGRMAADPEGAVAEFALMVRSDIKHRGLGHILLETLLTHATERGLREVWGSVAADNRRMLDLASTFGFERKAEEDAARVRVTKVLPSAALVPGPLPAP